MGAGTGQGIEHRMVEVKHNRANWNNSSETC